MGSQSEIVVREATLQDRKALRVWYCDPLRTAYRKNLPSRPSFKQHSARYSKICSCADSKLYIGLIDILRIGVVCFEPRERSAFEAKLYLKPSYCGKGLAPLFLKAAGDKLVAMTDAKSIYLDTTRPNKASELQFAAAGFVTNSKHEGLLRVELALQ